jgi:hypothetical protein
VLARRLRLRLRELPLLRLPLPRPTLLPPRLPSTIRDRPSHTTTTIPRSRATRGPFLQRALLLLPLIHLNSRWEAALLFPPNNNSSILPSSNNRISAPAEVTLPKRLRLSYPMVPLPSHPRRLRLACEEVPYLDPRAALISRGREEVRLGSSSSRLPSSPAKVAEISPRLRLVSQTLAYLRRLNITHTSNSLAGYVTSVE